ncbi:MAG: polymerase subunit UmuD [Candidatus Saccharibacteria bacterium]|nr:polymerase subunit UmuD [Candidatus Saccharibacteria bacterium]
MDNLQTLANGDQDGVTVHTGFPNPALDHRGQGPRLALDINQLLVRHPSSTYLFRIAGHRWSDQGVYDGDIAVIDRSTRRGSNDLVVIWDDAGFSLQRHSEAAADIWGVVTAIIHQFDRGATR